MSEANRERFESADRVEVYGALGGLTPAETKLVERWVPLGSRVLDLGMGTGRTYPALAALASSYVGIDYAASMVSAAQNRFPSGRFEVGDAAGLSRFEDGSFDVVVFSYNGLDYLHPIENRERAFSEICRVLTPAGTLIMSTHNARAILRRPAPQRSGLVALCRALVIAAIASARAILSLVLSPVFWRGHGYRTDPVQGLVTYFASPDLLDRELADHGFQPRCLTKAGVAGMFNDQREQFLRTRATRCQPHESPWILLLENENEPVAGLLGTRFGDTFCVYKTGWDPDSARLSPGTALGAEAMRWAEEAGMTVFDYLRGERSHKADLGCRSVADLTIISGSGPMTWMLALRERFSADGVRPQWYEAFQGWRR